MRHHNPQSLYQWFQKGNSGTKKSIAKTFRCSTKTIERWIKELDETGKNVPFQLDKTQKVYALPNIPHKVHRFSFTDEQLYALIVASEAALLPLAETPFGEPLADVFTLLLQNTEDSGYDTQIEKRHWYFENLKRANIHPQTFQKAAKALHERRFLKDFAYKNQKGDTKIHQVLPYGMAYVRGSWLLVGKSVEKGHIIDFNLSRIQSLEIGDIIYADDSLDLAERLKFGIFQEQTEEVIRIKVHPAQAHYFEENFYHPTQQIEGYDETGWLWVSFESWSFRESASFFLSWKDIVQVIEPPELVTEMQNHLRNMMQRYGV
jgi:predicted DNA-binding transcriptional regulator YafY